MLFVFLNNYLSYAPSAWCPYSKGDKELLEKVQKRAVMMVTNVRGNYEERLAILRLRKLEDRRNRGDMIETYKILTGKSKVSLETWFCLAKEKDGVVNIRATKGYLNLVVPPVPQSDIRRNFFSHRVVPFWNSLPESVKISSTSNHLRAAYDSLTSY